LVRSQDWLFNGFVGNPNPDGEGHGLFYQADDAARALREGRTEGFQLDLDKAVLIMEIMDEVRHAAGLRYPDALESTDYPLSFGGIAGVWSCKTMP